MKTTKMVRARWVSVSITISMLVDDNDAAEAGAVRAVEEGEASMFERINDMVDLLMPADENLGSVSMEMDATETTTEDVEVEDEEDTDGGN